MSALPETNGIVDLRPRIDGATNQVDTVPTFHPYAPAVAGGVPAEPALTEDQPAETGKPKGSRPTWAVPGAIAAVGLIASAALGGFLVQTTNQRDTARHQLATTQAQLVTANTNLASTQDQLAGAQRDASAKAVTAKYMAVYVTDSGRVQMDAEAFYACNTYAQCRPIIQQLLTDEQAFQNDRAGLTVPSELASADAMLKDGLSAAIASSQEFITGMDTDNAGQMKEGGAKFDAAMLSIAKAEVALGLAAK